MKNFQYSDFKPIKNIALKFPGPEESVSHEITPAVNINGKLFCGLHDKGTFVTIRIGFENQDSYLENILKLRFLRSF